MKPYLAVDWGTTNVRAWRVGPSGTPLASKQFRLGVSQLEHGTAAGVFEREIRPALEAEALPALMCGMIGSDLGWRSIPYVGCPAGAHELAAQIADVSESGPAVRIVPGLSCAGVAGAPDVIRGEETQAIGWMTDAPERAAGVHVLCQPGTHSKWMLIENGQIVRFLTAMTGELFDVLSHHSVLRAETDAEDGEAFDDGLAAAGDGDALSTRLFSARSRIVAGGASPDTASSYLSGLLIGAEIAATPGLLGVAPGATVVVLGAAELCARYSRALRRARYGVREQDGGETVLAGLNAFVAMGALE